MFKHSKKRELEDDDFDFNFEIDLKEDGFKDDSLNIVFENTYTEAITKISKLTKIPTPNEMCHIVTRKNINAFDFILAIAKIHTIKHLYISVYRIGKSTSLRLIEMINEGMLKKVTILINDGFRKLMPDVYNILFEAMNEGIIEFKEVNNHTKIIAMDCGNDKFVIEGSGNLSRNARIEQYIFINSELSYNFHKNWIDGI